MARVTSRSLGSSVYRRRSNGFQDTWNTLRSGYGGGRKPARRRRKTGIEWMIPGHRTVRS